MSLGDSGPDALVIHSESQADVRELYVVFRVADTLYAVPARGVLQIESYTTATEVPGARSFVAGVAQIRGKVVPIIDLRVRFGLPRVEPTSDTRIVVLHVAGRVVGLVTDAAREVVRVAVSEVQLPPKLVEDEASGFVRALARVGERMFLVLNERKVVGEEELVDGG